jgi:hypothetical protein
VDVFIGTENVQAWALARTRNLASYAGVTPLPSLILIWL